jgi:hypothetical protein
MARAETCGARARHVSGRRRRHDDRALHPNSRRDACDPHRGAGRQRTAAGTAGDGLEGKLDAVGHGQHLTPHRRDIQGEAGARPDPRLAPRAGSRSGQGACARIDSRRQPGHHRLEPGHNRLELDGHLGTDGHVHLARHADALIAAAGHPDALIAAAGHPDALIAAAANSFEWQWIGERHRDWRRAALERLVG